MLIVPLAAIPNQSFNIFLDNNEWDFTIYTVGNVMAADVVLNGAIILLGQRLTPVTPVIPYRYLENGNFLFITENFDYPDYTMFGASQNLFYVSPTELEAIRASA
jgi:hypothetical protein